MDSTIRIFVTLISILFKCVRSSPLDQSIETLNDNETINEMKGKIVGGDIGKIENFPHAVFLHAECAKSLWTCGSSILNQQILLTAAHCVYNCKGQFKIHAYAGSANYITAKIGRHVARYIVHRDYNDDTVQCDIAVLMLNKRLPYSQYIKRVIVRPNKPKVHAKTHIAGWGSINEQQDISTTIKYVEQTLWTRDECEHWIHIHDGTICAAQGRGSYPYTGDSGSGLIAKDFQVVGLVSYRVGSIKKDLVVYTDVSHYYKWINEKVYTLFCQKIL